MAVVAKAGRVAEAADVVEIAAAAKCRSTRRTSSSGTGSLSSKRSKTSRGSSGSGNSCSGSRSTSGRFNRLDEYKYIQVILTLADCSTCRINSTARPSLTSSEQNGPLKYGLTANVMSLPMKVW